MSTPCYGYMYGTMEGPDEDLIREYRLQRRFLREMLSPDYEWTSASGLPGYYMDHFKAEMKRRGLKAKPGPVPKGYFDER